MAVCSFYMSVLYRQWSTFDTTVNVKDVKEAANQKFSRKRLAPRTIKGRFEAHLLSVDRYSLLFIRARRGRDVPIFITAYLLKNDIGHGSNHIKLCVL